MAFMTTDLFAGLQKKLQWQEQYFLMVPLWKKGMQTSIKNIKKNIFKIMWMDVGMAVPKPTETRCRDGSVQAIQRLHN